MTGERLLIADQIVLAPDKDNQGTVGGQDRDRFTVPVTSPSKDGERHFLADPRTGKMKEVVPDNPDTKQK